MTDFLKVQAKRTFAIGSELKTRRSEPFDVESGEARMLENMGLVAFVDADEPEPDPADKPQKRGKKGGADADHTDT